MSYQVQRYARYLPGILVPTHTTYLLGTVLRTWYYPLSTGRVQKVNSRIPVERIECPNSLISPLCLRYRYHYRSKYQLRAGTR